MACEFAIGGIRLDGALAVFGALCAVSILFKLVLELWRALYLFVLPTSINLKRLGKWAVVTGATDGIGKAYVDEMARKGLNVMLISRSQDKIETCIAEFSEKYSKVEFRSCAVDFSGGPEIYDEVKRATAGLDIGVLVNNVGMSFKYPMFYTEMPESDLQRMINVNISSMTFMTYILLPGMLERRRGAVVNIASFAGCGPAPLLTVYSGTKAYMDMVTRGLQSEYSGKGVYFQCVCPGLVATKLSSIRRGSLFAPFPKAYVRQAVKTIGLTSRTHAYWAHSLQGALLYRYLPTNLMTMFVKKLHMNVRTAAIRKLQKKAEKKDE